MSKIETGKALCYYCGEMKTKVIGFSYIESRGRRKNVFVDGRRQRWGGRACPSCERKRHRCLSAGVVLQRKIDIPPPPKIGPSRPLFYDKKKRFCRVCKELLNQGRWLYHTHCMPNVSLNSEHHEYIYY